VPCSEASGFNNPVSKWFGGNGRKPKKTQFCYGFAKAVFADSVKFPGPGAGDPATSTGDAGAEHTVKIRSAKQLGLITRFPVGSGQTVASQRKLNFVMVLRKRFSQVLRGPRVAVPGTPLPARGTAVQCCAVPCRALPCLALPGLAVPCRAVPGRRAPVQRAVHCIAGPCRAVPCRALPCRALPCRAVPCHAVPCHAVSCRAVSCRAVLVSPL